MIYKGEYIPEHLTTVVNKELFTLSGDNIYRCEIVLSKEKLLDLIEKLKQVSEYEPKSGETMELVLEPSESYVSNDFTDDSDPAKLVFISRTTIEEPLADKTRRIANKKAEIDDREREKMCENERLKEEYVNREIEHLRELGYTITKKQTN